MALNRPPESRQWFLKFSSALIGFGLQQSHSDDSLFFKHTDGAFFGLIIYVDDMFLASDSAAMIEDFKIYLGTHFKYKDLGVPKYYLHPIY